jgi:hypothetical protein
MEKYKRFLKTLKTSSGGESFDMSGPVFAFGCRYLLGRTGKPIPLLSFEYSSIDSKVLSKKNRIPNF